MIDSEDEKKIAAFATAPHITADASAPAQLSHVQRMEKELAELRTRVSALATFINTNPIFASLVQNEQSDMESQLQAMNDYVWFLGKRLERAGK